MAHRGRKLKGTAGLEMSDKHERRDDARRIVILTGAGISAESGVPTFRDAGGLWEGHRIEEVATPGAFLRNPRLVHRFYNLRRADLAERQPNAAHQAISRLQACRPGRVFLVTQNVDDLHERGGSSELLHMHGELRRARCERCLARYEWDQDLGTDTACWECGRTECVRPDIVWFGEMPYGLDLIEQAMSEADLFIAIGTSGLVYPAAGLVELALERRIPRLEFNLTETDASPYFSETFPGPATQTVPRWVEQFLTKDQA